MIIRNNLRDGSHSPAALFREARNQPTMRHAVKMAPRSWWKEKTEYCGGFYTCLFFHRHPVRPNEKPPGWVVETRGWHSMSGVYSARAKADGFEVHEIAFAHPDKVFDLAAREFGLTCYVCESVEIAHNWDRHFMCFSCKRQSQKAGGVERFLAKQIQKRLRELRRAG